MSGQSQQAGAPHPDTNALSDPTTEYALRYGVSQDPHIRATSKSGITPTTQFNKFTHLMEQADIGPAILAEKRQLIYLSGLKTWEVIASGSIEKQDAKRNALPPIPFNAVFRRNRWTDGDIPVDLGIEGTWSGHNDEVWGLLQPCINLASHIVSQSYKWVW